MTGRFSIIHFALNPHTGPWSLLKNLATAQRDSGLYHQVGIGVLKDSRWPETYADELSALGISTFTTNIPSMPGILQYLCALAWKPPFPRWIASLCAGSQHNVIVIHLHNAWISGVFLPISCRDVSCLCVATFHGVAGWSALERQPVRRRLHRWFAQRLLRHHAKLTSVDTGSLSKAEPLFGLSAKLFSVVPNGAPARPSSVRPFTAGANSLTLAHIGSLTEEKGWEIMVQATLALRERGLLVKLVIAGTGPQENLARSYAAEHPDCVQYFGSIPDPCNNLLPQIDVFALMTSNDGLPMAIIEAMSCGVPVISTAIGGIPGAIRHGISGYIIERSSSDLVRMIDNLYSNPDEISRLGDNARCEFKQRFELRHIVKEYDAIYRAGLAARFPNI